MGQLQNNMIRHIGNIRDGGIAVFFFFVLCVFFANPSTYALNNAGSMADLKSTSASQAEKLTQLEQKIELVDKKWACPIFCVNGISFNS